MSRTKMRGTIPSVLYDVLPTDDSITMAKNRNVQGRIDNKARASSIHLPYTDPSPFTKSFRIPLPLLRRRGEEIGFTDLGMQQSGSFQGETIGRDDLSSSVDKIVTAALDSIIDLKNTDYHPDSKEVFSLTSQKSEVTHRKKSNVLLRHCSSWTQLDDNKENRALFDGQGES